MEKRFYKKIILGSILGIILLPSFFVLFPQKTNAGAVIVAGESAGIEVDPTTLSFYADASASLTTLAGTETEHSSSDTATNGWNIAWNEIAKKALTSAIKALARQVINNITEATVDWINNGFQGQPSFISNPSQFLLNAGDQVLGNFIQDSSLGFMCAPFQLQIKLALGLNAGATFRNKIGCTLTGVVNNVQNAGFSVNGAINVNGSNVFNRGAAYVSTNGWADWLNMTTQPQNNPIGAYLLAKDELDKRVAAQQNAISSEINRNQGALDYKQCTVRTYDASGDPVPGIEPRTYSGSDFYNISGSATLSGSGVTGGNPEKKALPNGQEEVTTCKVTSPGSVIKDMLSAKANGDHETLTLVGALGDGVDSVLSALMNQLIKAGLNQLHAGVLGDQNSIIDDQNNQLKLQLAQVQQTYNDQLTALQNSTSTINLGNPLGAYTSALGAGYVNGFNTYTGPANTSALNSSCAFDPLSGVRQKNITRLKNLYDTENTYQTQYKAAEDFLKAARVIFLAARNCNAGLNSTGSVLRSRLIDSNVISNIDGIPDSSRDIASIPWNLATIDILLAGSAARVKVLDDASMALTTSATSTDINAAMITVNSTSFSTAVDKNIIVNIRAWLTAVQKNYTSSQCPIDISSLASTTLPVTILPTSNPASDFVCIQTTDPSLQLNQLSTSTATTSTSAADTAANTAMQNQAARQTLQQQLQDTQQQEQSIQATIQSLKQTVSATTDPQTKNSLQGSVDSMQQILTQLKQVETNIRQQIAKL